MASPNNGNKDTLEKRNDLSGIYLNLHVDSHTLTEADLYEKHVIFRNKYYFSK